MAYFFHGAELYQQIGTRCCGRDLDDLCLFFPQQLDQRSYGARLNEVCPKHVDRSRQSSCALTCSSSNAWTVVAQVFDDAWDQVGIDYDLPKLL